MTVLIDGEPWFVAKDVAGLLGYTNTNKAVSDHCHGVPKCYPIVDSMGRNSATLHSGGQGRPGHCDTSMPSGWGSIPFRPLRERGEG